jgi:type II restriction enzyme
MRDLSFYKSKGLNNSDEVFKYFFDTILSENRTWEYFINWEKVFLGIEKYKIELNILNSLCGSKNFNEDFTYILGKYPEVIEVFPLLLGVRDKSINVLDTLQLPNFEFTKFNFNKKSYKTDLIKDYLDFFEKSGLKNLIIDGGLTNLKDYSFGVEVGLDTNGRKNRGGTIMENLVEKILKQVYKLDDNEIITQSNSNIVKQKWGIDLPVDKSNRRPDFVIYKNNKIYWVETNFYSGGGSKLKSTCGEYKFLYDFCKKNNVNLIWITDGNGWNTCPQPLKETFLHTDYVFNLTMLKDGVLNEIFL